MNTCKKCESEFQGNYCHNCGTPLTLRRINGKYILSEIGSLFNFEKGFLYTIRELIIRPGENIRIFIQEDRNRLVKPIIFLILCSLLYTLAQQAFQWEDGYVTGNIGESTVTNFLIWIQNNYGYANVFMGLFIGLWTRTMFRKSGFNIYENLIVIFFAMGIGMLIFAMFGIVVSVTGWKILPFGGIIGVLYAIWVIGSFFYKGKVSTYIKAFFAYFLGYFTFMILVVLIAFLIDLISKGS
ncbi:MAG: DUF3667 domain-containing protein [Saprospiraceae bacterium]|nr:DUF3667 domain-containing protein [Saprospiraceae bacterium]